jgi:RNA polymerase sigma-70 factor (ECF subfamily)
MLPVNPLHDPIPVEQLAAEAQQGRSGAFDELTQRLWPWLTHELHRACHSWQEAEDLAQETLLRLYQGLARYDPDRPLRPWVKTIAQRLAIDHARGTNVRQAEPLHESPSPQADPQSTLEARELWQLAGSLLPPRHYAVLHRRYAGQQSVAEIADELQASEANVKVMLFRARKTLANSPQAQALLDHASQ